VPGAWRVPCHKCTESAVPQCMEGAMPRCTESAVPRRMEGAMPQVHGECRATAHGGCHTTSARRVPCHSAWRVPCHSARRVPCHSAWRVPCHSARRVPCHTPVPVLQDACGYSVRAIARHTTSDLLRGHLEPQALRARGGAPDRVVASARGLLDQGSMHMRPIRLQALRRTSPPHQLLPRSQFETARRGNRERSCRDGDGRRRRPK